MKKTLIALALGALFASCGQESSKTVVNTVPETSGLNPIFNLLGPDTNNAPIELFLRERSVARGYANLWDTFMNNETFRNSIMDSSQTYSFIIPASNLRYLLDTNKAEYMIVYLGIDTVSHKITLVYDGAKTKPNEPKNDTLYEIVTKKMQNREFVLDNVFPCPICDKVGLTDQ